MKDWLIKNFKVILPWVISLLLAFFLVISVRSCQAKSSQQTNNIHALVDSITYYQSQIGALVATKTAFESNIEELKLANSKLYDEIKDMKLKSSKVDNAYHVEGDIDFGTNDTIYIVKFDTIDNSFTHNFDFSNDWRTLIGKVNFRNDSLKLNIDKDIVYFDYTLAMDKDNHIFIKSNNPYVKYSEFSGFTVPKYHKKHFSIGPSVGVGYGVFNKKPDLYLGITVNYNLFEF